MNAGEGLRAEHVLALQQTAGNRAVQRLLSRQVSGRQLTLQRRMSWENTNWASARYLDASGEGSGGVLFVGEQGREVVVKPKEGAAAEGALAAWLHNQVATKKKGNTNLELGLAPGLRVVTPQEGAEIKAALNKNELLDQAGSDATDDAKRNFKKDRAKTLVGLADKPGTVVQDLAKGTQLSGAMEQVAKHTEKRTFGGRKLRKGSPLRIFKDKRSIRALGLNTAVDLVMGNQDRLLYLYNAENFMVTPYSLTMIDNIWMGSDASYWHTGQIEMRDVMIDVNADEGIRHWKGDDKVKKFVAGDHNAISKIVWDRIIANAAGHTRDVDQKAFAKVMSRYQSRFRASFGEGLQHGKAQLLESLDELLADQSKLQKLAPAVDISDVMRVMKARRDFLAGEI